MNYIVLDLETANPDYSSICQVGYVVVQDGEIVDRQSLLVDPDDYFDPWNVAIHGITEEMVEGAPTFDRLYGELENRLGESIVVHHGPFDRVAMQRACARYQLGGFRARWLDNQCVVRRTWPEFSRGGYGLAPLAAHFNIAFEHHDALEDARAAEAIFRHAVIESGLTPADWVVRAKQPISPSSGAIARLGDATGDYLGETIVFTGSLRVRRTEAADAAQKRGFNVEEGVNRRTTVLCIGIQDRDRLKGYTKSSKQRKAEQMNAQGHDITIVSEEDFWTLMDWTD